MDTARLFAPGDRLRALQHEGHPNVVVKTVGRNKKQIGHIDNGNIARFVRYEGDQTNVVIEYDGGLGTVKTANVYKAPPPPPSSSSASAPVLKVGDFKREGVWRVPSDSEEGEDGFPRFDEKNDMPAVCAWSYREARMPAGDSEPDEDASAPVPKANAPSTLECAIWMPPNDVDVRRAREDGLVCVGELVGFHSTVPASSASGPAPIFDFRRGSDGEGAAMWAASVSDPASPCTSRASAPAASDPVANRAQPFSASPRCISSVNANGPAPASTPSASAPVPTFDFRRVRYVGSFSAPVPPRTSPASAPVPSTADLVGRSLPYACLSSDSSEGSDDDDVRTDSKSLLQPGYTVHNSEDNRFYPRPESSNKMPRRH